MNPWPYEAIGRELLPAFEAAIRALPKLNYLLRIAGGKPRKRRRM